MAKPAISRSVRLGVAIGVGLLAHDQGALAQQPQESTAGIQEVVITAQKREENLQATPIAISAITAEGLADRGVTDLEGVARVSPSISFTRYPSSSNTLILFIRGQGVADPGQITLDSAVGLYQDGFYIPRGSMATFDLADIERVEVLRGPQGTLYGRNTTGGAINLISRKPSGELSFKQELGFGNNGRFRSLSVLDLPKWGGLFAKFAVLKRQQDGYVKNIGSSNDFGQEDQKAGRLALHWDAGMPITADYFFERGDLDSTPIYFTNRALVGVIQGYADQGMPERRTYRAFDLPESKGEYEAHGLTLSWDIDDALTLRSLTGYRDVDSVMYQDYAEAFFSGFAVTNHIVSRQLSQEVQAMGALHEERLKYIAGLYYSKEDAWQFQHAVITNALPGSSPLLLVKDRTVVADAKSKAAFAQLAWTPPVLDDRLELTLGGRYTKDERSAERWILNTYFGFPIGREPAPGLVNSNRLVSTRFNPSFTASFAWTDDLNTYLRVATGYKAGGSGSAMDLGQFGNTFKPEDVTTYELGLKSYFLDRRLRLNGAVFNSKFDDKQMFFNTNPGDTSVVLALNAGKGAISGLELEALWQPTGSLSFTFDYTYLDTKLDQVIARAGTIFDPAINSVSPYQVGQNIKDLFQISYAPENSLNVGANWVFLRLERSEISAIVNYRWEDRTYLTETTGKGVPGRELYSRPALGLLDGRVSWKMDLPNNSRARVDFWGNNLADEKWGTVVGFGGPVAYRNPSTGLVTRAGYTGYAMGWAERRTFGVNFAYQF